MFKPKSFPGYYFIKRQVRNNTSFDIRSNVILFSDPRGGSTWFSECLVSALNVPLIWEPLHIGQVKELKSLNFGWREYIREDNKDEKIKDFFSKLFEGKIKSDWLYQYSSLANIFVSKSAIFKICRGNQMIPYLTNNFDFHLKPIYLIRHPLAVVSSQLRQGGWSDTSNMMSLEEITNDPLKAPHKEFLSNLNTKEEILTANWCLVNKIPVEHPFNTIKWITVTYEEFILEPEKTFERLEREWGKNLNIDRINFNKSSFTSVEEVKAKSEKQLTKWKTQLTTSQIKKMLKVLTYFDIKLYTEQPLPTKKFNK